MKVLKVIHGYPPLYNAGSEVYSQTLVNGLKSKGHDVAVFSREEDPFRADFDLRYDSCSLNPGIPHYIVNYPRSRDRYRHSTLDDRFKQILNQMKPDIVHIGHLNHLSTSMVDVASNEGYPIVFTLHDFWLMCPRGQFLQTNLGEPSFWNYCNGQENSKCAVNCYSRYFSGSPNELDKDIRYWTDWIKRRMEHVRSITKKIDLFIAPSSWLYNRFVSGHNIDENSIVYLDYGFDHERLRNRNREPEDQFVFGYIGTHIPAKGIQHLIPAFKMLDNEKSKLIIWGRESHHNTAALRRASRLNPNIIWLPEYDNRNIVREVFNKVDAIVVPSIWDENSPLVIHEAQQARVPVITADHGGMAEYVKHGVNGLLFKHRDPNDLCKQMKKFIANPEQAVKLGNRGYLYSPNGDVPSVEEHVEEIINLYDRVLS